MPAKFGALITFVVGIAHATGTTIEQRASIRFGEEEQRMKHERAASIEQLEHNMTTTAAIHILQQKNATPALVSMVKGLVQGPLGKSRRNKGQQHFLGLSQSDPDPPEGYSGMEKAREMLNEMLSEVVQKYDLETMRCKDFFYQQCEMMEICRQDISFANAACARARARILAAQAEINHCEEELPKKRYELKVSIRMCEEELARLRAELKVVLNDIDVMTSVLKMTDCDKKPALLQVPDTAIVTCNCDGRKMASFRHTDLRRKMSMLQSPKLKDRVMTDLQMLAEPDTFGMDFTANVSNFTNDPVPMEPIPGNPCDGIDFDDKSAEGMGNGKCSIASNPQCYKLQARFIAIQAGIEDMRDELLEKIEDTEIECKITQEILRGEIAGLEDSLSTEQSKLASATEEENTHGERGRLKGEEHKSLATDMFSTRQTCSVNLRTLESEECALKKIRAEIGNVTGDGGAHYKPFFQDCELGEWEVEECTVSCGGGTQKLTRSVIVPPYLGHACPPLEAEQSCGLVECPIECEMHEWEGWSSCSAECNGGVKQRTRSTKVHPRGDVDPCPESSETVSCNNEACDKECVLAEWSGWSNCSKACGGGHQNRVREVLEAAVGQGSCAEPTDPKRLEIGTCNENPCMKMSMKKPLQCFDPVDVILLIDGSSSLGEPGWKAAKSFATTLLSAFEDTNKDARISIIVFGGPRTFGAYELCSGKFTKEINMSFYKDTCGVELIQHFSSDLAASKKNIEDMVWPKSTTMLSLAMEMALTEIPLSRSGVKTYVVTVTDGEPLSKRKTKKAMKTIKGMSGVVSVVVPIEGTNADGEQLLTEEGLQYMHDHVASDNADDNTIKVDGFGMLDDVTTIDKLVVDMCRDVGQEQQCLNWCAGSTVAWSNKCTWPNMARNCGACPECP